MPKHRIIEGELIPKETCDYYDKVEQEALKQAYGYYAPISCSCGNKNFCPNMICDWERRMNAQIALANYRVYANIRENRKII